MRLRTSATGRLKSLYEGESSSRLSSALASLGLALPPLPFITWPTRNPNVFWLPARY